MAERGPGRGNMVEAGGDYGDVVVVAQDTDTPIGLERHRTFYQEVEKQGRNSTPLWRPVLKGVWDGCVPCKCTLTVWACRYYPTQLRRRPPIPFAARIKRIAGVETMFKGLLQVEGDYHCPLPYHPREERRHTVQRVPARRKANR